MRRATMHIGPEAALSVGVGLLTGGATFGALRSRIMQAMTYGKHREICDHVQAGVKEEIKDLSTKLGETHTLVREIHAFLRGRNGGQL
jgi:hypothetical protein